MITSAQANAGGIFDLAEIERLLGRLAYESPDDLESETLEFKSWCADPRKLAEKVVDVASCMANSAGGTLIIGVSEGEPRLSPCPHSGVDAAWVEARIRDGTHPPVDCRVHDLSQICERVSGRRGVDAIAVEIPRSRFAGGHVTSGGVGKARYGKECRPILTAEDDYTALVYPRSRYTDISKVTLERASAEHARKFGVPTSAAPEQGGLLVEARLLPPLPPNSANGELTLAALLLFGTPSAIERCAPQFETIVIANGREERLRRNIVDSVHYLLSESSLVRASAPRVSTPVLRELLVNAYVHRCYRTPSPIVIENLGGWLAIKSPGGLPAGMTEHNLIHGVPVYRNLTLARGARFVGICDEIGKGFDIIYDSVLRGGFDFPVLENAVRSFTVRLELREDPRFAEFVARRSQALQNLDELVSIRHLWGKGQATLEELALSLQRPIESARRVLNDALQRGTLVKTEQPATFALSDHVRADIESIFNSDQFDLFGEPIRPSAPTQGGTSVRSGAG